jgi:uncharacterized phage protein (predicted DNA packaging)
MFPKITDLDLTFVKEYLKVDYEDEDMFISGLIVASKSYIQTLLGYKISTRFPEPDDIPDELTIACIMIIAHWFDNRQIQQSGTLGDEMGHAFSAIISAHKEPIKEDWENYNA